MALILDNEENIFSKNKENNILEAKEKEVILTIPGCMFKPVFPATDAVQNDANGGHTRAEADNITFVCPLSLPDNSEIISILVAGNAAAEEETYNLNKWDIAANSNKLMESKNIGTEGTYIEQGAVVDNSKFYYWIETSSLDNLDLIFYARIKLITFE